MSLKIKNQLTECNPNAYLFDGFDAAIMGIGQQFPNLLVACYDYDKCIKILMKRDKMKRADAIEYFEYNVVNLGLGPNTPIIVRQSL